MTARIYSADEARALREAATPGPWGRRNGRVVTTDGTPGIGAEVNDNCRHEDFVLLAAAPDLAASVEHHAARADAAEKRVAELEALAAGPRRVPSLCRDCRGDGVVDDAECGACGGEGCRS